MGTPSGWTAHQSSALLEQSADSSLRRGDFTAAIRAYLRALEIEPESFEPKLGLARVFSLSGHNEDAKSLYETS